MKFMIFLSKVFVINIIDIERGINILPTFDDPRL